jgi:hypothetical protein
VPVYPRAIEPAGWRNCPATALLTATAQTEPYKAFIGKAVRTATGFTQIVGVMQGASAIRTSGGARFFCEVLVDFEQKVKQAGFLK